MKILHLSTSDALGGAAIASYRLHKALISNNIESIMLVKDKKRDDFTVITDTTKIGKAINKLRPHLDSFAVKKYKNKDLTLFSPSKIPAKKIINKINSLKPDIVHLHWICQGFVSIEDLTKINAPIIWTLHDNWPFTGGCHIMWDCRKYIEYCGACPRLNSKKENDLSRKIYLRKKKAFSKISNIKIVGVSSWISKCAKQSSLFKSRFVSTIPNLLSTDEFKQIDSILAKEILNISKDKKVILFGALSATSDVNKGFNELKDALSKIETKDVQLVVFGSGEPEKPHDFGFDIKYCGQLHDDVSLSILYNAADVMVVPSRQESFGQTASESMACGTPVVAFNHTGLTDIVDHKVNGYLAKALNTSEMANGIDWVLNNKDYKALSVNARKKVVNCFDGNIVSSKYIELYSETLSESKG